jgi:hypothetical protein
VRCIFLPKAILFEAVRSGGRPDGFFEERQGQYDDRVPQQHRPTCADGAGKACNQSSLGGAGTVIIQAAFGRPAHPISALQIAVCDVRGLSMQAGRSTITAGISQSAEVYSDRIVGIAIRDWMIVPKIGPF